MPDFNYPQSFSFVLALIVPGLIITFVRTQFTTGRMQKHSDAMLSYFALSAVYGYRRRQGRGFRKVRFSAVI
jgi:hypothetical protein